jgi:formate dehydrogenase iron-sulfur subunit
MGGLAVMCAGAGSAQAASAPNPDRPGLLVDVSRCVGCGNCQRGCIEANQLHPAKEQLAKLSDQTYTFMQHVVAGAKERYVYRSCMHCLHPACVAACTVGALQQTAEGVVVVDTGRCIGCRYCQYACPFNVPQFEWSQSLGTIRKCTACVARLRRGEQPACTANCPTGALKAGMRSRLMDEAHMRIAAHPEFYVDHIYGEAEVGGTDRLYISDVSFAELELPTLGTEPAPLYAEAVMSRTPTLALSVAAMATGIYTVLKLRGHGVPPTTTVPEEIKK